MHDINSRNFQKSFHVMLINLEQHHIIDAWSLPSIEAFILSILYFQTSASSPHAYLNRSNMSRTSRRVWRAGWFVDLESISSLLGEECQKGSLMIRTVEMIFSLPNCR